MTATEQKAIEKKVQVFKDSHGRKPSPTELAFMIDGVETYEESLQAVGNSGAFGQGSKKVNSTFSSRKYRNRFTANNLN